MSYTPLNNTVLTGTPEVKDDISIADDVLLATGSVLDWDGGAATLSYDGVNSVLSSDVAIRVATAPSDDADLANKGYVDSVAMGLDVKASVRVASQADVDLAAPGASIDGVSMASGERVLVKEQANPEENGIYIWNGAAAAMTRASDADTDAKVTAGMFTFVEEGTSADQGWVLVTDNPIDLGVTELVFSQFSNAVIVSTLDSLTDVDVAGAVSGSALIWDGMNWVDTQAILLDDAGTQITVDGGAISTEMQSNRFRVVDGSTIGKLEADGVRFEGPTDTAAISYDDGTGYLNLTAPNEIHMQANVVLEGNNLYVGDGTIHVGPNDLTLSENAGAELESGADFRAPNLKTGGSVFIGTGDRELLENGAGELEAQADFRANNFMSDGDATLGGSVYIGGSAFELFDNGANELEAQADFRAANLLTSGDVSADGNVTALGTVYIGGNALELFQNIANELEANADFRASNLATTGDVTVEGRVLVGVDALEIKENGAGNLEFVASVDMDNDLEMRLYTDKTLSPNTYTSLSPTQIDVKDGDARVSVFTDTIHFHGTDSGLDITFVNSLAGGIMEIAEGAEEVALLGAVTRIEAGLRFAGIATLTGAATLEAGDHVVLCDTTGGAFTVTLPAAPVMGQIYQIKDAGGAAESENITIAGNGNTIDGSASFAMGVDYQSASVIWGGSEWHLI